MDLHKKMEGTEVAELDRTPAYLNPTGVAMIEVKYRAIYMGAWALKTADGGWSQSPVDIFFQADPDVTKGHSHYFGILFRGGKSYITRGDSAFPPEGMLGKLCPDGTVIVSRYRHGYVERDGVFVDGGRDYFRSSTAGETVVVYVDGANFRYKRSTDDDAGERRAI